jgi:hypothetical protein
MPLGEIILFPLEIVFEFVFEGICNVTGRVIVFVFTLDKVQVVPLDGVPSGQVRITRKMRRIARRAAKARRAGGEKTDMSCSGMESPSPRPHSRMIKFDTATGIGAVFWILIGVLCFWLWW